MLASRNIKLATDVNFEHFARDVTIAAPELRAARIFGVPADDDGFIPTDRFGVVLGVDDVSCGRPRHLLRRQARKPCSGAGRHGCRVDRGLCRRGTHARAVQARPSRVACVREREPLGSPRPRRSARSRAGLAGSAVVAACEDLCTPSRPGPRRARAAAPTALALGRPDANLPNADEHRRRATALSRRIATARDGGEGRGDRRCESACERAHHVRAGRSCGRVHRARRGVRDDHARRFELAPVRNRTARSRGDLLARTDSGRRRGSGALHRQQLDLDGLGESPRHHAPALAQLGDRVRRQLRRCSRHGRSRLLRTPVHVRARRRRQHGSDDRVGQDEPRVRSGDRARRTVQRARLSCGLAVLQRAYDHRQDSCDRPADRSVRRRAGSSTALRTCTSSPTGSS